MDKVQKKKIDFAVLGADAVAYFWIFKANNAI